MEAGEIFCELEGAGYETEPGLLIVTDLKLLWLHKSLLRRPTRVISLPLGEIEGAEGPR